jgi:hypothetical protein
LPVLQVQIAAGGKVKRGPVFQVGKAWLAQRVMRGIAERKLICPPGTPGASILLAELQRMVAKWQRSGYVRYEASAGHDDCVLALALALLAEDAFHATQA